VPVHSKQAALANEREQACASKLKHHKEWLEILMLLRYIVATAKYDSRNVWCDTSYACEKPHQICRCS
jgi:hypothetical protein